MKIGKIYRFEAAHHLPGHTGKCAQLHGHSYRLEVEIEGDLIPVGPSDGGMVADFSDLDEVVNGMIDRLDHTDLNVSARMHLGVQRTTAELLVYGMSLRIRQGLSKGIELSRLRLYETARGYAEWP